jgi:NitT/TauT family transport system substrate-binding protein
VVVAYIKALIEANTWVRGNPTAAAAKIEEWTRIEKEVAYLYLGPGGIHTLDPTIKPRWLETIKTGHEVLTRLNRVKPLDINAWVDERYVRQAYQELKLDYDAQKQTLANYDISGTDTLCKTPVTRPKEAGEVWIEGAPIAAHASPACTLAAINKAQGENRKVRVAYLNDKTLGIKLFADKAFYAVSTSDPRKPQIVPFLLRKDAQAEAAAIGGKLATYTEALAAAGL